jgi:hypothetical protein
MKLLKSQKKGDISILMSRDNRGMTPLHSAAGRVFFHGYLLKEKNFQRYSFQID